MLPSDRKNLGCVGGSGNTSSLCWAEPPAHLQSRGPCVGTSAWGRIPPYHWAGNSRAASICSSVLQCGSDGSALWVRPRGPARECSLGVVPNLHPCCLGFEECCWTSKGKWWEPACSSLGSLLTMHSLISSMQCRFYCWQGDGAYAALPTWMV